MTERVDGVTIVEFTYTNCVTIENCIVPPEGSWKDWSFDEARRWLEHVIERDRIKLPEKVRVV